MESPMSEDQVVEGVGDYQGAAAGWGALKAVADAVRGQMGVVNEARGLLTMNQAGWVRLPGLRLGRSGAYGSSFEFCENGAKAVSWEATSPVAPRRPSSPGPSGERALDGWSDYDLENVGRLTEPMRVRSHDGSLCRRKHGTRP
jgi:hypothetical protein